MARLADVAQKVRSKNAGPFWITVDIFCGSADVFDRVRGRVTAAVAGDLCQTPVQTLKRFEIADLNVLKISFPRPAVQGTKDDRDMHGASFAALFADLEV